MPSKSRWDQFHISMLGEGKDRARPLGTEGGPFGETPRERRWTRPIALVVALISLALGAWLIWGADVMVGGILVLVMGGGGGLYVAATSRPERP